MEKNRGEADPRLSPSQQREWDRLQEAARVGAESERQYKDAKNASLAGDTESARTHLESAISILREAENPIPAEYIQLATELGMDLQ